MFILPGHVEMETIEITSFEAESDTITDKVARR